MNTFRPSVPSVQRFFHLNLLLKFLYDGKMGKSWDGWDGGTEPIRNRLKMSRFGRQVEGVS